LLSFFDSAIMRGLTTLIVFLPRVSSLLSRREVNDPAGEYLTRMCMPLFSNTTRSNELHLSIDGLIASLAYSPFPCEQQLYIETICEANGTTEIDFLAEQECLCGGAFWEAWLACGDCYFAHGEQQGTPAEAASALSSSVSPSALQALHPSRSRTCFLFQTSPPLNLRLR
jgi:hypothetical protein